MLDHRLRQWPNINPTLFQCPPLGLSALVNILHTGYQETLVFDPMLFRCWLTVCDAGPTSKRHWISIRVGWDTSVYPGGRSTILIRPFMPTTGLISMRPAERPVW